MVFKKAFLVLALKKWSWS